MASHTGMLLLVIKGVLAFLSWLIVQSASAGPALSRPVLHVVDDYARTLGEVSILLYGNADQSSKIAAVNSLKPPFRLKPGDRLRLPSPPKLSTTEGRLAVLNHWRQHFGLETQLDLGRSGSTVVMDPAGETKFVLGEPTPGVPVVPVVAVKLGDEIGFEQAVEILDKGAPERAAQAFKKLRSKSPRYLPAWFYELHCLRQLGRRLEVAGVLREFANQHPGLLGLPAIKKYQEFSVEAP